MSTSPLDYLEALSNPWVLLGVSLPILWTLSRMALLSVADLSFAVPATAASYVLETVLALYVLRERICTL